MAPPRKRSKPRSVKKTTALEVKPQVSHAGGFLSDEQASILSDYIRLYVGQAMPFPTFSSGVYQQQDQILLTQSYLNFAGYDLYDQVELDPQVSAGLMARKLSVAGLDWKLVPPTESVRDVAITESIEEKIRAIPGFFQDLIELLDAIGKGFSVSEIIWTVDDDGFVVPKELLNRPQRRIQFDATSRWPKIRTLNNPFYGDPADPKKFIVHRNSQKYENPFGDAIDQRLYWMWLFKRTVQKFWMTHAQSTSAPVPIIKVPNGASQTLKSEALSIVAGIRSSSYGYIPDNMTIEWAESKNVSTTADTYEKFVRYADEQLIKAIIGQTLTTDGSGAGGSGSRALGEVHQGVRQDIMEYDAKSLADTLTSTLVKWMCDFNYSGLKRYPCFEFQLDDAVDIEKQTRSIQNLSNAGFKVDRNYIVEILQIPLEETEETTEPIETTEEEDETSETVAPDDTVAVES